MSASESFEQRRLALRNRPRRLIANNDGGDVFQVPADREPSTENLLAERTRDLSGSHVDVISYTTISSGFGFFTHNTKVGEVLTAPHPNLGNNIAPALIEQDRDCLRIMVDFGHEHDMEVFWSMRMNDTHDRVHRPDRPYFLFPRLKAEHPEYLMGTPDNEPRYGGWSKVDYGQPDIRELAFRFVEEVCQNYDVGCNASTEPILPATADARMPPAGICPMTTTSTCPISIRTTRPHCRRKSHT